MLIDGSATTVKVLSLVHTPNVALIVLLPVVVAVYVVPDIEPPPVTILQVGVPEPPPAIVWVSDLVPPTQIEAVLVVLVTVVF
jgi:hypothetical protein